MGNKLYRTPLLIFMVLVFAPMLLAQTGTSTVRGTVADAQGNTVAGATVRIINLDTKGERTQVTTDNGLYAFTALLPGNYQLQVEGSGFKKAIADNVRALVDSPTEINFALDVGDVTEVVTVTTTTAEALLNTQDATLGNNFVSQQITQLPLEARNAAALLSLQPGVTPQGYVTGSRSDQANLTLDGVDVNDQETGVAFAPVLRVTPDSVTEFRVTTTNANANQGRSSGAQVSLITKTGTNSISGGVFEFHRNTVTSANTFFNNRNGLPRPKLLRNTFGGFIGGPIVKDKAFFFYTYEGRRDARGDSVLRTVPLPSLGQGTIRFLENVRNSSGAITGTRVTTLTAAQVTQLFPQAGVNPAALALLADAARRYPANDFLTGDSSADRQLNTAGFRFNAPVSVSQNTHIANFNWNVDDDGKHQLSLRGNYQTDVNRNAPYLPDTSAPRLWSHPTGVSAGYIWTFSDRLVNNFRYGVTRVAFSNQGDSADNSIVFRDVFQPVSFARTFDRVNPTHNITNDLSFLKGNHSLQFGTNIRAIRNRRTSFAGTFDAASVNFSVYEGSGGVLDQTLTEAGFDLNQGFLRQTQTALASVIGRISQYNINYNYDLNGDILPAGQGIRRVFATEEYDVYAQDSWRVRPNLTLTYGLRYGLSRPVYEQQGYQTNTNIPLGELFRRRVEGMQRGEPFNETVQVDLGGPVNNRPGFYELDKNNFQPRIAFAYSPDFGNSFIGRVFGARDRSVIRGGFAITNDYIGQQIALQFNANNQLGFNSSISTAAGQFNVTDALPPQFTGIGQSYRGFPGVVSPEPLVFPLEKPADNSRRIEASLDSTIVSPLNYSWNLSFERTLPGGLFFQTSYVGRAARNLLAARDTVQVNNLTDPRSGVDWYGAIRVLADYRNQNLAINQVPAIPYFDNLFPNIGRQIGGSFSTLTPTQAVYRLAARRAAGGLNRYAGSDWTFLQDDLDSFAGTNLFFHPQYATLAAYGTFASSDYHGATLTVRQRLSNSLIWDFNYTFSKSLDNASGLQRETVFESGFIVNPFDPNQNRAASDFDLRHIINANGIYELPIGRNRRFLNNIPRALDAIIGGFQLTGIFRFNTGLPLSAPVDAGRWATNWQISSRAVRVARVAASPTRGGNGQAPNLFSDVEAAYDAFRNPLAGEVGDRNILRLPGYINLDMGLNKTFIMPWSEKHALQFRYEVFNVTNTQRLTGVSNFIVGADAQSTSAPPNFGNFTTIQGEPRVMQFGLRYTF